MSVQVGFNDSNAQQAFLKLALKIPAVAARVVRRAAVAARTDISRRIAEDTALPARRVADAIKIIYQGQTQALLEVKGKRIPLIDFRARGPEPSRGKGRGVSWTLPGGRQRDPHAFIATMPGSGHRGVYVRKTTKRHPIRELFGPSIVNVFKKFVPLAQARAREVLSSTLRHELARLVS